MRNAVVVDLDGTLANIDHRLHFVQRESRDYDAFYAALEHDTVNQWCVALMEALYFSGYPIILVSARRKSVEDATRKWLDTNGIDCDSLVLLRADGDHSPAAELKMKWLAEYGAKNVLFVIDDNQKVVDAWRAAGVVCLQCAAWTEWKKAK